jgi:hypothetical protein
MCINAPRSPAGSEKPCAASFPTGDASSSPASQIPPCKELGQPRGNVRLDRHAELNVRRPRAVRGGESGPVRRTDP